METVVSWVGGAAFVGRSGSGHNVVMDGPPDGGGRNLGPRPMEMLLLGMAACTAYDVVSILRKSRQALDDCRAEVKADRASDHPRVFTRIHVHFVVSGRSVDEQSVARATRLSAEKYCSASIMLGKTASISHDYEIVETGASG